MVFLDFNLSLQQYYFQVLEVNVGWICSLFDVTSTFKNPITFQKNSSRLTLHMKAVLPVSLWNQINFFARKTPLHDSLLFMYFRIAKRNSSWFWECQLDSQNKWLKYNSKNHKPVNTYQFEVFLFFRFIESIASEILLLKSLLDHFSYSRRYGKDLFIVKNWTQSHKRSWAYWHHEYSWKSHHFLKKFCQAYFACEGCSDGKCVCPINYLHDEPSWMKLE